MSEWSGLLQAAEQLANEVVSQEELPAVERSLSNLLDASTELYSRLTHAHTGPHDLHAYANIQIQLQLLNTHANLPKITYNLIFPVIYYWARRVLIFPKYLKS